jgi:hypothetical protein
MEEMKETAMKHLITTCALALLLAAPAYAQNTPKADAAKPAPQGMMMNCPMMGDTSAMQKDLGSMMGDVETMMKETKNGAQKDRLQKMHERMAVMMASMQKMGGGMMSNGMMGNGMMGGQQPGAAAPANPQAAPATPPVTPEDHTAHHPAQ